MANIREGARRMRTAGNLIMVVSAAAFVLFWVLKNPAWVLAGDCLLLGVLMWAAGWILDGFAE